MQAPILKLLMLLSVIVGTGIGVFATGFWNNWRSKRFRAANNIPDVLGKWRCKWFDDVQSQVQPKIEDTVEIQGWTADGQFLAIGHQPQFHLSYPLMGEIDPSRVITLVYKAARILSSPIVGSPAWSRPGMASQWKAAGLDGAIRLSWGADASVGFGSESISGGHP
jgi:hypothetical protein